MTVFEDSKRNPSAFCSFGAIPDHELEEWAKQIGLKLPDDLLEFWRVTGGGNVFESEAVLRPNVPSPPNGCFLIGDDVAAANERYKQKGLAQHILLFCTGTFLCGIDLRSMEYVTLSEADGYAIDLRVPSFHEWYTCTLRQEFAARYGLGD